MRFLPYEKITIKSNLRPDAVCKVIEDSMKSSKSSKEKIFRGKVYEDHFRIAPWFFFFYNGYLPVLKGKITPVINGSIVTVTIRPDLIQIVGLILFLIMILSGFVYEIGVIITTGQITYQVRNETLLFLGLFVFFYVMSMISYKPNILKYKKIFIEMLDAKEVINYGLFENLNYERMQ
jgi:hypothetical protein